MSICFIENENFYSHAAADSNQMAEIAGDTKCTFCLLSKVLSMGYLSIISTASCHFLHELTYLSLIVTSSRKR